MKSQPVALVPLLCLDPMPGTTFLTHLEITGWAKKNGATLHFPKYLENY